MTDVLGLILTHSPALIVAIPLLGAFLTPLVSRINDKVRNVFVILTLGLTGSLVLLLAYDVLINGIIHTYVFGGGPTAITLPSGAVFAIRILFEVDGMSIFMAIL